MDFELTSEHLMVKESATSFVKKEHSLDRLRKLKADPLGYSTDVWRKMIDLGWLGLVFPEEYGGLGLDFSFVMVLLEEFGRGLLPEPWISNILLGANTVLIGGSESQKDEIIPKVISGDCQVTLAYLEDDGRYDVNYCAVGGREINDGFAISGKKIFVLDGCSADKFIVSVRTSGSPRDTDGISLFMVDRDTDGVEMQPLKTMDGRNACILNLKGVSVSGSQMIGRLNGAYPLLNDVIDQATVAVCSEMVGGMKAALDMTVAYLCERVQFGKPIGSFQSIQHKVADMFIEQELAVAATYYATAAVSENSEDRASAVSLAKAKCSSAYVEITKRAIQLFGAIGFSNEADIGFYLKRAKVTEILFGDSDYHLRRYTDLKGY